MSIVDYAQESVEKRQNGPKVECPDCGAKSGVWCAILSGIGGWQHEARYQRSLEESSSGKD